MIEKLKSHNLLNLTLVLLLSSGVSVALVVFRIWYTRSPIFAFFFWNLWLAYIPFAVSLGLSLLEKPGKPLLVGLSALWLLFFPNAPYMITDLFHLRPQPPVPYWYDLLLIFSFAWNGLILGYVSLLQVQVAISRAFNRWLAWSFAGASLFLGSLGIYIGRYLRWNSWDIMTDPLGLLRDILERLLNPWMHPRTWGMTFLFFVFLSIGYLMMRQLTALKVEEPA